MNEKIFMNQKIIEAELLAAEEADILRFKFDEDSLDVNLNSPMCQNELKAVFVRMIHMLTESDVHLHFTHAENYNRRMYIEVCKEYIDDLNRELISVKERIEHELN